MSFGAIPFGEGTFAGPGYAAAAVYVPPAVGDPDVVIDPFLIEISGRSMRGYQLINTLTIDGELGRQGSAQFSLYNLEVSPQIGESVRILFYDTVIFVGAVDRVNINSNNMQTFVRYDFECTDNSYLLFRRKIKIKLQNQSVSQILAAVLLDGPMFDGITLGDIQSNVTFPMVEANGVSTFEFLSGVATACGCIFSIDKEKKIHFIAFPSEIAPQVLDGETVQSCTVEIDRETYRNEQWVTVTGTPQVENETALTVELRRTNEDQIIERAAIEGTSGTYRDITSITHPSSNNNIELTKFGNAYNKIQLGLTGSIRRSLNIATREIGFSSGQTATVDIPQVGASGEWIISRCSMREESGRFLVSDLQLRQTSLARRSQELWIEVIKKGQLYIYPPQAIYTNSVQFTSTGTWQVPSGVTDVQITIYGGGGGGGGGAKHTYFNKLRTASGAAGGGGGLAIKVLQVNPLITFSFNIGSGGAGGSATSVTNSLSDAVGVTGGTGGETNVSIGAALQMRAYGGAGGLGGLANAYRNFSISYPAGLGGSGYAGQAVTVGGAANGGNGGSGTTPSNGSGGATGKIVFEW